MSQELALIVDKDGYRLVYPYFEIFHANCKFCGYERNGFCWKKPTIYKDGFNEKYFVNSCKRTISEIENLHKKNGSAEVQPSTR